ncbi:hypothetical protein STIAU_4112 [Stigmatella aurantiaca DW4/3-1]|uniref:Uncharacterized protein n=1 Tax=Stigmatella aurantiaca (strain DW4/3-1) TaxID=378806 RepID=Q08VH8_STIAD|nr:hypothetical protein STIAU_4112 [Stigmatella aurantiaca DW4/3-1]
MGSPAKSFKKSSACPGLTRKVPARVSTRTGSATSTGLSVRALLSSESRSRVRGIGAVAHPTKIRQQSAVSLFIRVIPEVRRPKPERDALPTWILSA